MAVDLPGGGTVVSLFPLTGSLLLPGTYLPLNVFEPRYRTLVADALVGDRRIGMVQPRLPGRDNAGWAPGDPQRPALYAVGCLGELSRCEAQPDGRFLVVLQGLTRFRIREELAPERPYRRALADTEEFEADLDEPSRSLEGRVLLDAFERYRRRHDLHFDMDVLAALPGGRLVNALSVALPFAPQEKQGLLEAESCEARSRLLLDLLEMGTEQPRASDPYAPPTVH